MLSLGIDAGAFSIQLAAGYRSELSVPFIQLDLDYEHTAGPKDFELI